jgi:hypothetical protein
LKINIINAANLFFSNSSLESVYFEAVANSIDANASKIWIEIKIDDFSNVSSFELSISDNGDGFTNKNFHKFENLLEVEENTHKGVGRLVFLQYFNKVEISSSYSDTIRNFTFSKSFDGTSKLTTGKKEKKTTLHFLDYTKSKINEYKYLKPDDIRETLLKYFFLRFYKFKADKKPLEIHISLQTNKPNSDYGFFSGSSILNVSSIPDLKEEDCGEHSVDLFSNFELLYSIQYNGIATSLITAIYADDRLIAEEVISKTAQLYGYEMIFLLHSNYFSGKTNANRDKLDLDEDSTKKIKQIFSHKVSEIINREIPHIQEKNEKINNELNEKYPHLQGYFEKNTIGLIERDATIEIAQKKFLKEQKVILEASSVDDIKYEQYLDVSSRLLTEYILYRNFTIQKLRKLDKNADEAAIHKLLVPKRKAYNSNNFIETIFTNNAWVLDDKYMSYTTVLSEEKISEIYKNIGVNDNSKKGIKRPDITIIFSNDPEKDNKVDVVIVELKKIELKLGDKEFLIGQLREKARILLKYYPNKIQRIWFYGIVDIDKEFRLSLLDDEYIELYSPGSLFYREYKFRINDDEKSITPSGIFIQSYESLLNDAETRNSTFLRILKESIKDSIAKEPPHAR